MESTTTQNKISKEAAIKQFLELYYEIRFNNAIGKLELKSRTDKSAKYKEVKNEEIRELVTMLRDNGIEARKNDIYKAFNNQFSKPNDSKNQQIEIFIDTIMEVRFNEILQQPEYREDSDAWEAMTKYKVNSLCRLLDANGIKTSQQNLNSLFFSDYCPIVNPIKDYFNTMKVYNPATEPDYIAELASTVSMEIGQERWPLYLKKWLTGVVSNVFNDLKCTNQVMLVLAGNQGAFKTTWLENLCPKALDKYIYSGKINPQSKDLDTFMAENFIINIDDQLHILNKNDAEELKNVITKSRVKYRRPYDVFVTEYPHIASFCGSVNGEAFLNDPTGTRRFLSFRVAGIDIDRAQRLDINNVWRQANYLYLSGFRYWFIKEEVEQITADNEEFAMSSEEEQMIMKFFRRAEPDEPGSVQMQPAEILSYIQGVEKVKLSMKKVGAALQKLKFQKRRVYKGGMEMRVYDVFKNEIESYYTN